MKRQKKGGKLPVDLVKSAKIAISTVLGKGPARFEVALHYTPGRQRNGFDR
jgi:hypothetical protein